MARVILHADADAFYASVECVYRPELRDRPVAVCGDPTERHGIVLAKNQLAKQFGVKTAEPIWQAKQKCPDMVTLAPHYDLYIQYSRRLRAIYGEYTDRVEAFGLDENWLDVSGSKVTMEDGFRIASEINRRAREDIGITVSVGVSFNKVFAKLGSDECKPDGVIMFTEENYQQKVWPMPVSRLLYVGPATTQKLARIGIQTIGDLAGLDMSVLQSKFGKTGYMLKAYAMGLDRQPVMSSYAEGQPVKSIGNSTTPPSDIATMEDAKRIFYLLADSVAARLRESHFRAGCVSISARGTDLQGSGCQRAIKPTTNLSNELARTAMELFAERYAAHLPMRSIGLCCSSLVLDDAPVQVDMFGDAMKRERAHDLECALDDLRQRYGHRIIQRGLVLADAGAAEINPRADASPQAVAFVMGGRGVSVLG